MTTEGQTDRPPGKARLATITAAAAALAAIVTVCVILPAEFHQDPTGFGRATGLYKLGEPQPKAQVVAATAAGPGPARYYPVAYRTDGVEIPLAASGDERRRDELEYKVRMRAGDSLVYAWSVPVANPQEFYFDFHGETPPVGGGEAKVVEYKQATGTSSNGTLIAPIPGVHGWYLQNQSVKPVVVKLHLAGFYELVPPGEYGNEARISPKTGRSPSEES
jgi:hypothetical protein